MAYNYRGLANYWLGNYDAAIADFSDAINLFPRYDAAYYNRGFAYAKLGDMAAANADIGMGQRRGIVDPVADEGNGKDSKPTPIKGEGKAAPLF